MENYKVNNIKDSRYGSSYHLANQKSSNRNDIMVKIQLRAHGGMDKDLRKKSQFPTRG